MKNLMLIIGLSALFLSACQTSQRAVYDDLYISSADIKRQAEEERAATQRAFEEAEERARQREAEAQSSEYDSYSDEDYLYESDSLASDPQPSAGYNSDDYYDYQYSARLRRFYNDYYYPSYYNDFYTNLYWYDPNPYYYGTSIYFGYNFWYPSWRWGFHYRPSWYYPSYYCPYHGYSSWYGHHHGYYSWNDWDYPYHYNYNYYDKNTVTHRSYRPRSRQGGSSLLSKGNERPLRVSEDIKESGNVRGVSRRSGRDFVNRYESTISQNGGKRPVRAENPSTSRPLRGRTPETARQEGSDSRPTRNTGTTRSVESSGGAFGGSVAPSSNRSGNGGNFRSQPRRNSVGEARSTRSEPGGLNNRNSSSGRRSGFSGGSTPKRYQPVNPPAQRSSQSYSRPSSRSSSSSVSGSSSSGSSSRSSGSSSSRSSGGSSGGSSRSRR